MLRLIPLLLIVVGVYIGVQYKDTITDWLGQDTLDQIEQAVSDGTDRVKDKLEELKE
ncbi:hypothetical protein K6U56_12970 [Vibrio furnissii]|uniref:hypothetical protein n=1 Tax=Vibrio furnissii TaxID=29494 RepID=UPI001EEA0FED|nr:hypothetical protein [Vibrio furnissii]MCG6212870.1 hypothetical protein [Vibrio furnissii]